MNLDEQISGRKERKSFLWTDGMNDCCGCFYFLFPFFYLLINNNTRVCGHSFWSTVAQNHTKVVSWFPNMLVKFIDHVKDIGMNLYETLSIPVI